MDRRVARKRPWTTEEISNLKEWYVAGVPAQEVATRLGRTLSAVRLRISLSQAKRPGPHWWTPEEIAKLREHYATERPIEELAKALGRSESAVKAMARKLRLRQPGHLTKAPWTKSEMVKLSLWTTEGVPVKKIARRLNRSPSAVEARQARIGLAPSDSDRAVTRHYASWTASDKRTFAKMWAAGATVGEISAKLERTPNAIRSQRSLQNLPTRLEAPRQKASKRGLLLTDREKKSAWLLYRQGYTIKDMAKLTGIPTKKLREYTLKADRERTIRRWAPHELIQDEVDCIVERIADGCTCNCIARRLALPPHTIEKAVTDLALDDTDRHDETIWALADSDLTVEQIAWKLELPPLFVRTAIRRKRQQPASQSKTPAPTHAYHLGG